MWYKKLYFSTSLFPTNVWCHIYIIPNYHIKKFISWFFFILLFGQSLLLTQYYILLLYFTVLLLCFISIFQYYILLFYYYSFVVCLNIWKNASFTHPHTLCLIFQILGFLENFILSHKFQNAFSSFQNDPSINLIRIFNVEVKLEEVNIFINQIQWTFHFFHIFFYFFVDIFKYYLHKGLFF